MHVSYGMRVLCMYAVVAASGGLSPRLLRYTAEPRSRGRHSEQYFKKKKRETRYICHTQNVNLYDKYHSSDYMLYLVGWLVD